MKHQRAVLPPRTDLTSLHKRLVAKAAVHTEDLYERLKSRLLPGVTPPTDDPFYRVPENLEAFPPGEVLDGRSVEVRGFRLGIKADAWQVKFRSTDTTGAAVSGVATVMIPRRRFDGPIRPLLSYQCAIDALGATADPSYTLRRGDQVELPLIALALRRGWAVVTTDTTDRGTPSARSHWLPASCSTAFGPRSTSQPPASTPPHRSAFGVTRAEPSRLSSRSNYNALTRRS